ncbi:MAG: FIG00450516: Zinc-finger domain protein, partial [uncultured Microvirga sp.]
GRPHHSPLPQRRGGRGHPGWLARVHVHRSEPTLRPSARLPRHGFGGRHRVPVLLDALQVPGESRLRAGESARMPLSRAGRPRARSQGRTRQRPAL